MSDELIEALEAINHARLAEQELAVELPALAPGHDMVVPEQLPAADAAFAEQEHEASVIAGWLGMWGGSLLLNDIAKDTPAESEDERKKKLNRKRHDCC